MSKPGKNCGGFKERNAVKLRGGTTFFRGRNGAAGGGSAQAA
jgi:hypothetical protein